MLPNPPLAIWVALVCALVVIGAWLYRGYRAVRAVVLWWRTRGARIDYIYRWDGG